jgi:hypothetical protein
VVDSVAGSVVGTDVQLRRRKQAAGQEPNTSKEDTMHPDIAAQLAEFDRGELFAEAAHQRLVNEARRAGAGRIGQPGDSRRRWRSLRLKWA